MHGTATRNSQQETCTRTSDIPRTERARTSRLRNPDLGGTKGIATRSTRSKKLLVAPGMTTSSKKLFLLLVEFSQPT